MLLIIIPVFAIALLVVGVITERKQTKAPCCLMLEELNGR